MLAVLVMGLQVVWVERVFGESVWVARSSKVGEAVWVAKVLCWGVGMGSVWQLVLVNGGRTQMVCLGVFVALTLLGRGFAVVCTTAVLRDCTVVFPLLLPSPEEGCSSLEAWVGAGLAPTAVPRDCTVTTAAPGGRTVVCSLPRRIA